MKNDFAEVKQFTRVVTTESLAPNNTCCDIRKNRFIRKMRLYVDSTFFDMFSYHFVNGSASSVMAEPYSIVLFKPVADKLFGSENAVGKMISIDNSFGKHDFKVTGVVDESLGKSHIHAVCTWP
jgi:putative ABC transport system permease protein